MVHLRETCAISLQKLVGFTRNNIFYVKTALMATREHTESAKPFGDVESPTIHEYPSFHVHVHKSARIMSTIRYHFPNLSDFTSILTWNASEG